LISNPLTKQAGNIRGKDYLIAVFKQKSHPIAGWLSAELKTWVRLKSN